MSAASDLAPGHCQEARQATAIKRKDNPYAPKWLSRNCGGLKPNAKPGVSQAKRKKYSSLRKYSNPHQRNGKTNQPNAPVKRLSQRRARTTKSAIQNANTNHSASAPAEKIVQKNSSRPAAMSRPSARPE